MKIRITSLTIFILSMVSFSFAQEIKLINANDLYENYNASGCVVIYDESNNIYYKYNPDDCSIGYFPASTFKVPNSLIYLENGIITPTDTIKWDGIDRGRKAVNRDQTLKSALQNSVVWVYERLTKQVGLENTKEWLQKFDYGNKLVSGEYPFWLNGDIRISADQQIEFLKKFYANELPIAKKNIDLIKEYMILEQDSSFVLRGKTGWAQPNDSLNIGWLIGYLTVNENVYLYAINVRTPKPDKGFQSRFNIIKTIFKRLGLINKK